MFTQGRVNSGSRMPLGKPMTDAPESREQPDHEDELEYGRYRTYEAEDGSLMLYDGQKHDAWIRSDTTVEVSD